MVFVQPLGDLYTYPFKKGIEMKPFDLEAAKRGEPIVTRDGREAKFIAHVPEVNLPVLVLLDDGVWHAYVDGTANNGRYNDLFMAPKKRTVWLVVLGHREARVYETQNDANGAFPSFKAYPVEIEE